MKFLGRSSPAPSHSAPGAPPTRGRIDRAQLERLQFPWFCRVEPRLSDRGRIAHITHTAAIALLQEARERFLDALRLTHVDGTEVVIASLTTDFVIDLSHRSPLDLGVGVLDIGRSSFRLAQTASQRDGIAVFAEVVQVARTAAGAVALPDAWRTSLRSMQLRPPLHAPP